MPLIDLLCTTLACSAGGGFMEANFHKVFLAALGVSFLTAAWFVRQGRTAPQVRGHAFEVLPPRQTPSNTPLDRPRGPTM